MTEIMFRGDWPDDVRGIVNPVLQDWIHLIPGWVRILYVRFESDGGKTTASIHMSYENRWATLKVRPDWLEDTPKERARDLVHEIAHLHTQPMNVVFMDVIQGLDKQFKDFAYERWKEAWEGTVEDLAWAFTEKKSPWRRS